MPDHVEFNGTYLKSVGRRKTSVAQVRLYQDGKGAIMINGKKGTLYFPGEGINIVSQPLKVTGHVRDFNFSIIVKGGGVTGQIEACRHGIARGLLQLDPLLKEALKLNGFLTRDPRKKERKKPGFKGARKRPQWSKR
ncbi:MAG: 30S ribosomal protein S9 [Bacillota bacterium]